MCQRLAGYPNKKSLVTGILFQGLVTLYFYFIDEPFVAIRLQREYMSISIKLYFLYASTYCNCNIEKFEPSVENNRCMGSDTLADLRGETWNSSPLNPQKFHLKIYF